jgi:hypothetical protein
MDGGAQTHGPAHGVFGSWGEPSFRTKKKNQIEKEK